MVAKIDSMKLAQKVRQLLERELIGVSDEKEWCEFAAEALEQELEGVKMRIQELESGGEDD